MRQALAFLTPIPGARRPTPAALRWFPAVGALLGLLLGVIWWGAARIFPMAVAAILVVLGDLGLTGLLHMDGLADSADGLLPHLDRQRRLAVMAEPDVGAFGAVAVGVVLLARWVALDTVQPSIWLLTAIWCATRTAMAAVIGRVAYARGESGLAAVFEGPALPLFFVVPILLATVALAGGWSIPAGPVAVASTLIAFAATVLLGQRRLGGYTGDVLGAAGVVGETVGLVVASAKW
jgi:adenosylcobinamide-GDP ribazoletransferase